jgi:hypothetical protein
VLDDVTSLRGTARRSLDLTAAPASWSHCRPLGLREVTTLRLVAGLGRPTGASGIAGDVVAGAALQPPGGGGSVWSSGPLFRT